MSIADVILFYSTHSQKCQPCINLIQSTNIPIKQIRLDTDQSRNSVINGNLFKIEYVPTLVLILTDGTVSIFEGVNKTMAKIESLLKQSQSSRHQEPPRQEPPRQRAPPRQPDYRASLPESSESHSLYPSQDQEMRHPSPHVLKKQKKRKGKKSKKSRKHYQPEEDYIELDEYPDQEEAYPSELQEYDEKEEYGETKLDFDIPVHQPQPPSRKAARLAAMQAAFGGSQYQPKKGSSDIMSMAKQMESDRVKTLGYSEKDLPDGGY